MIGNVAEMTMDTFQMTVGGRLHGSHGGFVAKGGSCREPFPKVLPGRRREVSFFDRRGAGRYDDLGFRLVVSAVNVTGGAMIRQLAAEYRQMAPVPEPEDLSGDMVDQELETERETEEATKPREGLSSAAILEELIAKSDDPARKALMVSLLNDLKRFNSLVEAETASEVQAQWRSLLYVAYGIRDTSLRRNLALNNIRRLEADKRKLEKDLNSGKSFSSGDRAKAKELTETVNQGIAALRQEVADFEASLKNQFNYYKVLLQDISDYPKSVVAAQGAAVKRETLGQDSHSKSMARCFELVTRDVRLMLEGRADRIKLEKVALPLPSAKS
jgi:hypothetical protein